MAVPMPTPSQKKSDRFPWPTVPTFLAVKQTRASNVGRLLTVSATLAYARLHSAPLHALSQARPLGVDWFRQSPNLYRSLLASYVDVRLSLPMRCRVVAQEVQEVITHLQRAGHDASAVETQHIVWRAEEGGWHVALRVNTVSPHEGLWILSLMDGSDQVVYVVSFTCVGQAIWIGAVQGPKGEAALARVREATKAMHGVRPHFFLVDVLRALAQAWGKTQLLGVDARHHPRPSGWRRQREGVKFDYTGFWRELGGTPDVSQRWVLPLAAPRKALEAIESKKRAMYRRRFAMLDAMTHDVKAMFQGHVPEFSVSTFETAAYTAAAVMM